MTQMKTFTISQLPQIKNIDGNDLLLVSDYDSRKLTTKKMTLSQLAKYVADDQKLTDEMSAIVDAKVNQILNQILADSSLLSAHVLNIISTNYDFVLDVLDGQRDNEIIVGSDEGA